MEQQDTVKVYSFRVFDVAAKQMSIENCKATRDAIVTRFNGEVLEGTGQSVSPDELDDSGCYRRIATGWGELS